MKKFLSIVKNHRKKCIFAVAITSFASAHLRDMYRQDILRRKFCDHIKPLGNMNIAPHERLRHLTVYLNPFARRGSLLKDFEKDVAPVLQLSGLDIQMVYTDSDVEVKDSVLALDPTSTDGVLIASDDHVLQKAVTAFLQRTDPEGSKLRNLPLGIAPVGVWNTFARYLSTCENKLQRCFDLLTPLLNNTVKCHNVLEISSIPPLISKPNANAVENASSTRHTYSLLGLEWSVWRDVEHGGGAGAPKRHFEPTDTNEHRGILQPFSFLSPRTWKRHFGVTWRFFWFWFGSNPTQLIPPRSTIGVPFFQVNDTDDSLYHRSRTKCATIVYTPACEGCSRCWRSRLQVPSKNAQEEPPRKPTSTFGRMFGLSPSPTRSTNLGNDSDSSESHNRNMEARSAIVNESCGEEHTLELDHLTSLVLALDGDRIRLQLQSGSSGILNQFLRFRSRLMEVPYRHKPCTTDTYTNGSADATIYCSTVRLYPAVTENEYFWIDNDHFEACPVDVHIRHNAIKLFQ